MESGTSFRKHSIGTPRRGTGSNAGKRRCRSPVDNRSSKDRGRSLWHKQSNATKLSSRRSGAQVKAGTTLAGCGPQEVLRHWLQTLG
jgi:hypothetical protein